MPRNTPEIPVHMNLNQLSTLTGRTYRFIRERLRGLQPVRISTAGRFYDVREALPLIYRERRVRDW